MGFEELFCGHDMICSDLVLLGLQPLHPQPTPPDRARVATREAPRRTFIL